MRLREECRVWSNVVMKSKILKVLQDHFEIKHKTTGPSRGWTRSCGCWAGLPLAMNGAGALKLTLVSLNLALPRWG